MSLLDDVSIVVTPNGYKAGELYAVIPVPTEGAEEVTNGDFATDSDWTKGTGWTISGGSANSDGANSFSSLSQASVLTIGKRYKLIVDINLTSGQLRIQEGGTILETYTTTGANTAIYYFIATATNITFKTSVTPFNGSIDNVSVKEYTAADMDVTRATDATRVDENGLVADVLSNVPRIDYTGGGCPHILAEPQRTNLVTYSEVYGSGTFFSGTLDSVIDNTTRISPSGDANATQVTSTGQGKVQSVALSLTQNTDYTLSFYAKNVDGTLVSSRVLGLGGSGGSNLTSVSYISELSTTEWTRITHSFNTGTNTTIYVYLSSSLNSGGTIQLWGAQLEVGSYATSYIPTSGSTVTRNQDIFTRDGIGSLINSTEGVLFAEIAALSDDLTRRKITISDGTSSNFCSLYFDSISNKIIGRTTVGGVLQSFLSTSSYTEINFNKIAIKWKENDFALWVNGTEVGVDSSGVTWGSGVLTEISLDNGVGGESFYGKVKQLQVYDTALTDDTIALLTS